MPVPTLLIPYTEEQYLALSAAIAQGALEVQYGDKKVVYRSLDDMIRILGIMGAALGVNVSGSGRRVADFNNGLGGNVRDEFCCP